MFQHLKVYHVIKFVRYIILFFYGAIPFSIYFFAIHFVIIALTVLLKSHSCNIIIFVWHSRSNRTSRKKQNRCDEISWSVKEDHNTTETRLYSDVSNVRLNVGFIFSKTNEVYFAILKSNNSNERIIIYYVIWLTLLVNQRSLSTR